MRLEEERVNIENQPRSAGDHNRYGCRLRSERGTLEYLKNRKDKRLTAD